MTPEPPPSTDGSSPPTRHRPPPENFVNDTTEMDLWDFDGDLEVPDELRKPVVAETKPHLISLIPAPRVFEARRVRKMQGWPPFQPAADEDLAQTDVNKWATESRSVESTAKASPPARTLDDTVREDSVEPMPLSPARAMDENFEEWDDIDIVPQIEDLPAIGEPETIEAEASQAKPSQTDLEKSAPEAKAQAAVNKETDDEFSPVAPENAVPISLRPRLGLSNFERIGLIGLLALFLGGGAIVYFMFLQPLAQQASQTKPADFPIKGSNVTVISAKSYWRAPVTDGADTDAFRRGTVLLPVMELAVTGGPADIRVFFRDGEGQIVGDAMTRHIEGDATLKIAATAGFDDPGMHAAYRTGESKPWTIEIREFVSGVSSDRESNKLFEMKISAERY